MDAIDASKYARSPVHKAVLAQNYSTLKQILASLPCLAEPSHIRTESASLAEEDKAEAISAAIDSRDVPNRETPLHLAVKLGDATSTELLMLAGANCNLQNEHGWSALHDAICTNEHNLAKIMIRHSQTVSWRKWCRRLPRVVTTMERMRDFYMEITFHFESPVIPFISRIAPSDTYKIWKRGCNVRADMTLAGFDSFEIHRSDQSLLFLGDGSEDGRFPRGSLCLILHKDKEMLNAVDGAEGPPTDEEIKEEIAEMSKTNIFRPSIDVTKAVLFPQRTWRRQERIENVGPWRSKVYDMHHVVVSMKSRQVPGAITDENFFSMGSENDTDTDEFSSIVTEEEKMQLEATLRKGSLDMIDGVPSDELVDRQHCCDEQSDTRIQEKSSCKKIRKGWLGILGRRIQSNNQQDGQEKIVPQTSSLCENETASDIRSDSSRNSTIISKKRYSNKEGSKDIEYRKGLRPILWLSPDFPLQIEELLPLLDILANKVKAIRRLRDLLTTKLPYGTFPVKVAIPLVPAIKVIVTFTKFEELEPLEDFSTPPSSPERKNTEESKIEDRSVENIKDPFAIPLDYTWTTTEARKKRKEEKKKLKKGSNHNQ